MNSNNPEHMSMQSVEPRYSSRIQEPLHPQTNGRLLQRTVAVEPTTGYNPQLPYGSILYNIDGHHYTPLDFDKKMQEEGYKPQYGDNGSRSWIRPLIDDQQSEQSEDAKKIQQEGHESQSISNESEFSSFYLLNGQQYKPAEFAKKMKQGGYKLQNTGDGSVCWMKKTQYTKSKLVDKILKNERKFQPTGNELEYLGRYFVNGQEHTPAEIIKKIKQPTLWFYPKDNQHYTRSEFKKKMREEGFKFGRASNGKQGWIRITIDGQHSKTPELIDSILQANFKFSYMKDPKLVEDMKKADRLFIDEHKKPCIAVRMPDERPY